MFTRYLDRFSVIRNKKIMPIPEYVDATDYTLRLCIKYYRFMLYLSCFSKKSFVSKKRFKYTFAFNTKNRGKILWLKINFN